MADVRGYDVFERACKEKNLTAYRVSKYTGVPTSTFTAWKQGKYMPKRDKLLLIANYLGITVESLLGVGSASDYDAIFGDVPQEVREQRYNPIERAKIASDALYQAMTDPAANKALYYLDRETAEAAQELFEDRDMKVLFDAARGANPKDIKMVTDMLKRLKGTDDDDTGC